MLEVDVVHDPGVAVVDLVEVEADFLNLTALPAGSCSHWQINIHPLIVGGVINCLGALGFVPRRVADTNPINLHVVGGGGSALRINAHVNLVVDPAEEFKWPSTVEEKARAV